MMKKLLTGTAVVAIAITSSHSWAATGDVEATADFIQGIVVTPTVTMDFGDVGFTAAAPGAGDQIDLGADAAVAAGGNLSLEGGTPVAGELTIVASASNIDLSCNATATLANAGGDTVTVNSIDFGYNATPAFGAGADCDGVVDIIAHTGGTDTVSVGGRLDGSTYSAGAYVGGVHNTTNAGGVPITFTIVYN
jgi:hypothetical protein